MEILTSVEFWKIVVPALIAIGVWGLSERSKLKWEQYKRKEENYRELIKSTRGFYVGSTDASLKTQFLDQLKLSWLYAPDEVIREAYRFLGTIKTASTITASKEDALSALVVAIRNDMLGRRTVRKSQLSRTDFQHLTST